MIKVIEAEDEFTVYASDKLSLNLDANIQVHARVPGHDDMFVTATTVMERSELRALRDHLNKLLGE